MSTVLDKQTAADDRIEILPVVFQSSGNLRLVRVPRRKTLVHLSENITEGLEYEFKPAGPGGRGGRLEVDQELLDRDDDFFRRNDPKYDPEKGPLTLEWLRGHRLLGERFYELPATPPDPSELLQQVAGASVRGDESALVGLYEQERRTFQRPEILTPIQSALDAIEEANAAAEQPEEPAAGAGIRPPIEE